MSPAAHAPFGKFQLIARLGKGGMGDVFLAVIQGFQGFKKLVVVKRLHDDFAEEEMMRTLFLEEGRLAARLNHPNVVQTNEVGELDGALYMSMEYLEGQTCTDVARQWKERPDPLLVARIISDALAGLHYAHELCDYDGKPLNIVHRDLSPHNIFITYEGVVKILDFGIAKAAVQSTKTEVGVFKGKASYMAPEQLLQAGGIDRRVDIFVLGIVLWEFLAGRRLFKAEGQESAFYRILHAPIPRLSTIVPDVDPALETIVARALERDVDQRYSTAQEMRDALEAYLASSGHLVRQDELGALVSKMFAKKREEVRSQVRTFIAAAAEAPSPLDLPSLSAMRSENEWSSKSNIAPPLKKPAVAAHGRSPRSVRTSWIVAPVAALALGVAWLLYAGSHASSSAATVTLTLSPQATAAPSSAGAAAAAPRAATPTAVTPTESEPPAPITASAVSTVVAPPPAQIALRRGPQGQASSSLPLAATAPPYVAPTGATVPAQPPATKRTIRTDF